MKLNGLFYYGISVNGPLPKSNLGNRPAKDRIPIGAKQTLIVRTMKITSILLLVTFMQLHARVSSQVTLVEKNVSLNKVFKEIQKQSGYDLLYSFEKLQDAGSVSIDVHDVSVEEALSQCLKDKPLEYSIVENTIIIKPKVETSSTENVTTVEQSGTVIKGQVTNEKGEPLLGVAVVVKGSHKGVATDSEGGYSLEVTADAQALVFSFIGMKTKEVEIAGKILINIQLEEDVLEISEVIATGYQTVARDKSSGSYVKLDTKDIGKKAVSNISTALIGMTPGMVATTSSDGQFSRFLVRGQGTFQSVLDRDPLIVVDGFPIQGVSQQGTGVNNEKNPFATVNPNDVESIAVLKDAAATSIYGARAANGVIVITTKRSKSGDKFQVDFNSFVSISSKPDLDYTYNMAGTDATVAYLENLEKYSLEYNVSYKDPYYSTTNPYIYLSKASELLFEHKRKKSITEEQYKTGINALRVQDGKWKDDYNTYLFRNQVNQQYNLSLRGNSDKNNYSFSAVYEKELSTSIETEKSKLVLNFMNTYEIVKNLSVTVGVNTHFANNQNNGIGITDLMSSTSPWTRLKNDDGSYPHFPNSSTMYEPIRKAKFDGKLPVSWEYNPLQDREYRDNTSNMLNLRLQGGINYKITRALAFSFKGQYESNTYNNRSYSMPESYAVRSLYNTYSTLNTTTGKYVSYMPAGGILTEGGDRTTSTNLRGQLDYNKTFNGKHEISTLIGAEMLTSSNATIPRYTRYGYNENTNSVMTYPDYITRVNNILGVNTYYPYASLPGFSSFEERFVSAYLNASYTYDGKYVISGSARSDASNFVSDEIKNKMSPFWALGGAWNISKENFIKDISFINYLKLRASYGTSGVAAGKRAVSTLTTLSVGGASLTGTNNEPYQGISLRGNSTLTWEKSKTTNVGVDFSLLNNSLSGSLEYYHRYSYDVLAPAPVAYIAQSQSSATYNNAAIVNSGIELSLSSRQKIAEKISWKGDFNLAYNKNEVLEHRAIPTAVRSYGENVYFSGSPVNTLYGYKSVGYSPEGFIILHGKDGNTETVKSRATTHYYDLLNGAKGETYENNNWYYYLGNADPKVNIGFTNTFRINNFTFSFLVTGRFGYLFRRTDGPSDNHTSSGFAKTIVDAMENDKNGYVGSVTQMPIMNDQNTTIYNTGFTYPYMTNLYYKLESMVEKGDHLRLNEIYLGYDVPKNILGNNSMIKSLNIFTQARSLGLLWTANKKGIDPDYRVYSVKPMSSFTFGFKLNF